MQKPLSSSLTINSFASNINKSESSVRTASTILFLERNASWESASYGDTMHLTTVYENFVWPIKIDKKITNLKPGLIPLLRHISLTPLFIAGEIVIP